MQFFAVFLFVRFLNNFAMRVRTRTRLISKTLTWDTSRCQMSLLLLSICCCCCCWCCFIAVATFNGPCNVQWQAAATNCTWHDNWNAINRPSAIKATITKSPSRQVNKVTQVLMGEGSRAFIIVFKCFEVCFVFVFDLVTGTPEKSLGNSCGNLPACNTPNMLLI